MGVAVFAGLLPPTPFPMERGQGGGGIGRSFTPMGFMRGFLWGHREILRHHIAIRIPTGETGMRQGGNGLKRGCQIIANRGEISQHSVRIHLALALNIGQHRIQGERIPMNVREDSQTHQHLLCALV